MPTELYLLFTQRAKDYLTHEEKLAEEIQTIVSSLQKSTANPEYALLQSSVTSAKGRLLALTKPFLTATQGDAAAVPEPVMNPWTNWFEEKLPGILITLSEDVQVGPVQGAAAAAPPHPKNTGVENVLSIVREEAGLYHPNQLDKKFNKQLMRLFGDTLKGIQGALIHTLITSGKFTAEEFQFNKDSYSLELTIIQPLSSGSHLAENVSQQTPTEPVFLASQGATSPDAPSPAAGVTYSPLPAAIGVATSEPPTLIPAQGHPDTTATSEGKGSEPGDDVASSSPPPRGLTR